MRYEYTFLNPVEVQKLDESYTEMSKGKWKFHIATLEKFNQAMEEWNRRGYLFMWREIKR